MTASRHPRAIAALLLGLSAGILGAAEGRPPLLPDGDFEHVDHGPSDWTGFGPGAAVVDDPDQAGHVLQLTAAEGAPQPAPIHVAVLAHAMNRLQVSARLRSSGLHARSDDDLAPLATITVSGLGTNGTTLLAQLTVTRPQDLDWTTLATNVPVPAGVIGLQVEIALRGIGTVWIDDVVLTADPPLPALVISNQLPAWQTTDATLAGIQTDQTGALQWLHLQPVTKAHAVAWASMAADWHRIECSLRLRGNGLTLGAAIRTQSASTASAAALDGVDPTNGSATGIPLLPPVRAGVLLTWVDDHDRPLSATYDDLMLPADGDWSAMRVHLDIPRPGALLRLDAILDGGGSLDVDSVQVLPVLNGD